MYVVLDLTLHQRIVFTSRTPTSCMQEAQKCDEIGLGNSVSLNTASDIVYLKVTPPNYFD